ncbi:MAG: glycine dehydrogenase (aminomethyl-transferring) [Candidatus Firestonebacteria bacterium RIFOXYC2_FULL_39_67]|nr:MAG: glycine dehydrogenase (aminomethyl-transferring) [Candidatus Firestonebacteria bacterium RIFOXYD2_FULL_39_29]OGF54049.1 MAG: glycine dehydrogenase (aminomethyl-transferring) [Candidatus Firestonebacteria bacterium RIFOXYC2_FULL_39_67]OGF57919.1 MAG: glycine dehydrogenase (aminomethyl-transferring) [Candidatus Firestonebacteria bacterium RifOxyC12_full_39_7]
MELIFEKTKDGRKAYTLPECAKCQTGIPEKYLRRNLTNLPEVSELQIVRHYTNLSKRNIGVDGNFYPLGSCTMKYNPKVNEDIAALPGFAKLHPLQSEEDVQGALKVMYELEDMLKEVSGMDAVTLQPAAGAHGEFTGLLIARAYHNSKGRTPTRVIVPDTSHGTNPSSAHIAGYHVVTVRSKDGNMDMEDLKAHLNEDTAVFMVTNPNTLGLFEKNIEEIAKLVHASGALMYMDGANFNAIMGVTRPGDFGVDIMHFNLHKTFATPHGGGGPGSGPVGVKAFLADFLPVPVVRKNGETYSLDSNLPKSIGKVKAFYGNFAVMLRAYAYLRMIGCEGIRKVSEMAVLNANYMKELLKKHYNLPYDRICKHEFVLSINTFKESGIRALDIAKRLLDYGYHPPTIYFPLIVDEAFMIEPTETEDKETLDLFVETLIRIKQEIQETPETVKNAPLDTPVKRLDEVTAARNPVLKYEKKR